MKYFNLLLFCFLTLFFCLIMDTNAQNRRGKEDYYDDYYDGVESFDDITWKQRGFEFYFGAGAYFGGKYTANYYNGAPWNEFNLNLLMRNEQYRNKVYDAIREAYRYVGYEDRVLLRQEYNNDSKYNVAMDIALGARYRLARNWFIEINYSFRRLTSTNGFVFDFPDVPPSNVYRNYSDIQMMGAKEDRHYIDLSIGYIFQSHTVVKPFFAIGGMFTYIRVKSFEVVIEGIPFDLMQITRHPNAMPGVQDMPNYRDWAGPGYGFSVTAGLKFAVNKSVSLDPVFQLSVASFGNGQNFKSENFISEKYEPYNTALGVNCYVGVRLVMSDAAFLKRGER